jgi:cellulose synthase/poly-beta-1,6-N-acetylglucosamine synthase-like glycosyltransferase
MALLVISLFFLLLYTLLIRFYYRSWVSLPEYEAMDAVPPELISVIIPARNEEKNIAGLLKALSNQSYPSDFIEILLVDDYSTDNTATVARTMMMKNLIILQPHADTNASSKKKAIETAVMAAKGALIVCTDADCMPHKDWLQTLYSFYKSHDASFIAAPVKFTHDRSLLHTFQSIDFLTLQGITGASVAANFHTMCNGANLAYKRNAFIEVGGYAGIDHVATGDDMLLMYKIWKHYPKNVFYLKSRKAIVQTEPMLTWKDFFMQRKRWASKSLVYDDYRIIATLFFVYLLNCLFIYMLVMGFTNPVYWLYAVGYWLLKTLVELPFVRKVAAFFGERSLLRSFFFLQPLHMLYTVSVGLISQLGKYEWKGRTTK